MRVSVTGHMGFVGSHLVTALKSAGHEVIGFDKRDGADLSDMGWADYFNVGDVIVHLASTCSTQGSIERPAETFRDTVITTGTVCEWASRERIPLILTSSVKARDGRSPYGAAKVMAETWASEMGRTHKFPVVINRPGTIYGPGQEGSPESGWVAWFCKAKAEGIKVTINGDGQQIRDLLHVSDYVRLLMMQIEDPVSWLWPHPWDVGGGTRNAISVVSLARHLGLKFDFGPERYGDARSYVGRNESERWRPEVYWKDAL